MADSRDDLPTDADLDLRLVRYFTTVAEFRHFGRAAAELRVAQPSLSRQIRRLEQQVGARLLDRTPQGTRLTAAGELFLPRAKALLRLSTQAAAVARSAAEPTRITVGLLPRVVVGSALRELRRQHSEAEVITVDLTWNEPRQALLDHRVDAAVTRLPINVEGLYVTVLYDEPRVLAVPLEHRLAGKDTVTVQDLAGEPLPRLPDPAWNAFVRADPRPDGSHPSGGPDVELLEDTLELVAAGQAVAILPASFSDLRSDIATRPLEDVEPVHVVLATRADDRSRLVADLLKYARTGAGAGAGATDRAPDTALDQ